VFGGAVPDYTPPLTTKNSTVLLTRKPLYSGVKIKLDYMTWKGLPQLAVNHFAKGDTHMSVFDPRWGKSPTAQQQEDIRFTEWLLQRVEAAWGMALAKCNKRIDHRVPLISIGLLKGGELAMGFNIDVFLALSQTARQEALMLCIQKLLNGQISSMGQRITRTYGETAAEIGLMLALTGNTRKTPDPNDNSKTRDVCGIDVKQLCLEGFWVPEPSDLGLPNDKTWEFYAAALVKKLNDPNDPLSQQLTTERPATLDQVQAEQKQGKKTMPSAADIQEEDPAAADNIMQRYISSLEKEHNLSQRGLVAGEGVEWITVLFTPPQEDWRQRLKFKEEGAGRQFRVPTKRRLSRRGNPELYQGRKHRGESRVLVGMDTSGSRSDVHIASAFPELRAMVYRGSEVWLCQVDATIQDVAKFSGDNKSEFEIFGRGGTAMQPLMDQLPQICGKCGVKNFDLVVLFTDGFTDEVNFADQNALVLVDSTGADIAKYKDMIHGSNVEIAVLNIGPDMDPNNLIGE
jgi:hypothetical protein